MGLILELQSVNLPEPLRSFLLRWYENIPLSARGYELTYSDRDYFHGI
jgi:hypothetical protein